MEDGLQRMEVELRLLRKKYYFLQETIENKVDGRVKNILDELEDALVERVLQKVLIKINEVSVLQSDSNSVEINDDIGMIQLQSAGEVNGEMIAANVKQEPVDYDEAISNEEVFEYNCDPDDQMNSSNEYEESSLVIGSYTGSHFVPEAQLGTESNEGSEDGNLVSFPELDLQENYLSDSNPNPTETIAEVSNSKEDDNRISPPKDTQAMQAQPKSPFFKSFYENAKQKTPAKKYSKKRKIFGCRECEMQFTTASFLRRHMVKHVNARPFTCTLCPKSYKRLPHLNRHMKDSHSDNKIGKGKKESKEMNLKSPPIKAEVKSKSNKADIKLKTSKADIIAFEVTGTKNNYDCSICGKHFTYPSHLKPHLLGHARKLAKQGLSSK